MKRLEICRHIWILLTFEFLVFNVIEVANFIAGGPIRIVPDVLINSAEPIQAIFDLYRFTVVCYLVLAGYVLGCCLVDGSVFKHLPCEEHLYLI